MKPISALDIINSDPDFVFVGNDKNGTPVFELKPQKPKSAFDILAETIKNNN